MADKKIEEATRVTSVSGSEILPASVSGAAKSLTTEQVKSYVVNAVANLSGIEEWTPAAGDAFMVRTSDTGVNNNHYVAFDDLVSSVFNALTGKGSATLSDDDVISIKDGTDAKTVTVGALKTYISTAFSGNMDIHGLTAADSASSADELAAYQAGDTNANRKVTVAQLATAVAPTVATAATESTTAIADTDAIIIARAPATAGGTPILQKVPLQNAGLSVSNAVTGPSSTVENKIPQWTDGSRGLKNGLSLTVTTTSGGTTQSNIGSSSTDSEVPSSSAVYHHVQDQLSSRVEKPSGSTTNGRIPRWGATSGKLENGLSFVQSSGISSNISSTSTDDEVPSARAVYKYGDERLVAQVTCPVSTTSGKIPQWNNSSKELRDGLTLQTSVRDENTASHYAIATERAVRTSMAGRPNTTTENNIPQWDEDDGMLKNGLSVSTTIGSDSTNSQIPTALAVYNSSFHIYKWTASSGINNLNELFDGKPYGSMCVAFYWPTGGGSKRNGLFINIGDETTKAWEYLCDVSDALPAS